MAAPVVSATMNVIPAVKGPNPTIGKAIASQSSIAAHYEKDDSFWEAIKNGYVEDSTFSKVISAIDQYTAFRMEGGLLYTKNHQSDDVLCIPRALYKKQMLPKLIIDQAHKTLGHFGAQKTSDYVC